MKKPSPLRAMPLIIRQHHREINIPRPPAKLAEVVSRARRDGTAFATLLDEMISVVRATYRTAYIAWFGVPPEHVNPQMFTSFDRVLWTGGFCIMLFETLCAAVLAAITLAGPTVVAILVGIALTVVFTLATKAVWHLHIAPDEIQPRRALATLYRWLMPLFAAWALVLAAALLLPRLVDESTPALNICFNIIMSLLTVLSAALSGLLFTAAHLYGWARRLTRRYHEILSVRRDVDGLLQECDRAVPPPGPTQPIEISKHRDSTELMRQVNQTGIVVVIALALAIPAYAQNRGEFWMDDSRSPKTQDLRSAEDQFFSLLPLAIDAGVNSWDFFRFSRDAAVARPVATLHATAFIAPECESSAPSDELRKLFRRPQRAEQRAREKRCTETTKAAREKYVRDLSNEIAKTRAAFDAAPRQTGTCTALLDLMDRLRNSRPTEAPRFVVIASDGIESCRNLRGTHVPKPGVLTHVILVFVPSMGRGRQLTPWQEFELRRNEWGQAAPWVEVMTVPLLTAQVFAEHQQAKTIR